MRKERSLGSVVGVVMTLRTDVLLGALEAEKQTGG
jgi:hypothetical protein